MTSNLLIQFLRPVLVTVSHCMLVKYITLNSIYNSLSSVSACFFWNCLEKLLPIWLSVRFLKNLLRNWRLEACVDLLSTFSYKHLARSPYLNFDLRCFDTVFQRPERYFSIALKVVFSLYDRTIAIKFSPVIAYGMKFVKM